MNFRVLAILLAGCGGKRAPSQSMSNATPPSSAGSATTSTKPADDCATLVEKLRPVLSDQLQPKDFDDMLVECRRDHDHKDDPVFQCVLAAVDSPAVRTCVGIEEQRRSDGSRRINEAALRLNVIAKNAKTWYVTNAGFPVGKVGPTPSTPCCQQPAMKCAVSPEWGKLPVWPDLDFAMDEQHRFRYGYESDGKTARAYAIGDLDCDGVEITYRLELTGDGTTAKAAIFEPAPNSD
ncbi:MAG: hypothetical protein H0T42_30675 [Deltaproteobacteria bacterium]|nr:hypothetical protein [Deltaproteobacteria bacterium]